MIENCCQLDPAHVHWETQTHCNAKFDVAEGPNSEDELRPSGKWIGVFWALLRGYGGGWSRDDHSRCCSMRIAHSARKKTPKLRIFNAKLGFGCNLAFDTKVTTRYWSTETVHESFFTVEWHTFLWQPVPQICCTYVAQKLGTLLRFLLNQIFKGPTLNLAGI